MSPSPPQTAGADPVIGINDIGRFTITPSSVVNSDVVTIGQQFTGVGYAVVSGFDASVGTGAVWNTNSITVGSSGTGSLEVLDGAIVTVDFVANPGSGDLTIGLNPDSLGRVVVRGRGSLLRVGDDTLIGHNPSGPAGSGTLIIEDEGYVIATNDASTGTDAVTLGVRGRIELNNGRFRSEVLSNNGTIAGHGRIDNEQTISNLLSGRVAVGPGQRLVINGGSTGGVGFDNDGQVAVTGGELEFFERFTNTNQAAALTLHDGVVHFPKTGFGFDSTGGVLASIGGVNDVYGTVRIKGASSRIVVAGKSTAVFHEPVTNSGATIEVFPGSTAVYLQGLTTSASSTLSVHLAGPNEDPDFSAVEVAGAVALDGALQVQLASGFVPAVGDSFRIVSAAGGITGSLSLSAAPALPTDLSWDLDVNATSVMLSVAPALAADFDEDGDVDAADLTLWKENFATSPATHMQGDADGDQDADGADFLTWQQQLGSASSTHASSAVPETSSLSLSISALAAMSPHRRRRRVVKQWTPAKGSVSATAEARAFCRVSILSRMRFLAT